MAHRNLTYDASQSPRSNPFSSGDDNRSSYDLDHQATPQGFNRSYGNFDSPNGTTANLLENERKSFADGHLYDPFSQESESDEYIQEPPEYDRYPSMNGSRVVSSSSLSSNIYPKKVEEDKDTSLASKMLLNQADFSPFGGYPASSFPLHIDEKEQDDYLHNPDPLKDAMYDKNRFWYDLKTMDKRAAGGIFGFLGLLVAAVCVFVLIPALTYTGVTQHGPPQTYETLSNYKYPLLSAVRTGLIDPDTPKDVYTKKSIKGNEWKLVFSDEFNAEGRTFYDGDDQFFQAMDFNYASTQDLEWYDPDAVTTKHGFLNLRMDAYKNHDLFYRSGMVQSWNKMCFTQGRLEISARLPSSYDTFGLWPGMWTMGNLGRPGYMATTEGVWPYSYDSCDAGITPNQSSPDGISYLPGQRLNKCTCPGEDHPNPGTGRGAPEIDVIEAEHANIGTDVVGVVSQSLQLAPMDIWYYPDYSFMEIYNSSVTVPNTYTGGPLQQAVSSVSMLNVDWYETGGKSLFQTYSVEFMTGKEEGYVTWYVGENPTLTAYAQSLGPNGNIDFRLISNEPMSIVLNMGISNSWSYINWPGLVFPVNMDIDFVRVYQPEDEINITCDPEDFPTSSYIESHQDIYTNNNITSFEEAGYKMPKNSLANHC